MECPRIGPNTPAPRRQGSGHGTSKHGTESLESRRAILQRCQVSSCGTTRFSLLVTVRRTTGYIQTSKARKTGRRSGPSIKRGHSASVLGPLRSNYRAMNIGTVWLVRHVEPDRAGDHDRWRHRHAAGGSSSRQRHRSGVRSSCHPRRGAPGEPVRRVARQGTISYQRRRIRIGAGFAGMRVGVYPTDVDGLIRIQFYATTLKEVNLHDLAPT